MKIDFTTNYCGAYWSDGQFQASISNGKSKPVSELDSTCQEHDRSYSLSTDLKDLDAADSLFYKQNYGKGIRRTTYAVLVKYGNKVIRKIGNGYSSRSDFNALPSLINKLKEDSLVRNGKELNTDPATLPTQRVFRGPDSTTEPQETFAKLKEYNPYRYNEKVVLTPSSTDTNVYYPFKRSLRRTLREKKVKLKSVRRNRNQVNIDFE